MHNLVFEFNPDAVMGYELIQGEAWEVTEEALGDAEEAWELSQLHHPGRHWQKSEEGQDVADESSGVTERKLEKFIGSRIIHDEVNDSNGKTHAVDDKDKGNCAKKNEATDAKLLIFSLPHKSMSSFQITCFYSEQGLHIITSFVLRNPCTYIIKDIASNCTKRA